MEKRKRLLLVIAAILVITFFASCGNEADNTAVNVDIQSFYDKMSSELDITELHTLSEKKINSTYGIDASACPQIIIARSNNALVTDEIWLIEAANAEDAEAYAEKAKTCIEQKCQENENYLPDQYAVAKNGKVVSAGNYVAMFVSPDADAMESMFKAACGK